MFPMNEWIFMFFRQKFENRGFQFFFSPYFYLFTRSFIARTHLLRSLFTNWSHSPIVPSLFFRFCIHCHEHHFPNNPFATEPPPLSTSTVNLSPCTIVRYIGTVQKHPFPVKIALYLCIIYVNNRLIQVF